MAEVQMRDVEGLSHVKVVDRRDPRDLRKR